VYLRANKKKKVKVNMNIELSIVVPIYNVELYLEECLDSIYDIKNIKKEVILVNDGSTDNSLKIAKKYKDKYPNITKVINKKNGGLSSARNAGIEVATGEYISFIDSDDFIDSKNYEKFFKEGRSNNLDIIVGTPIKYIDGKLNKFFRDNSLEKLGITDGVRFLEESIKSNCYRMEVWDDIYRLDLLKKNRILFFEKLIHEDELFTPLVFLKAKRVKLIDINFYYYRQRPRSIMSSLKKIIRLNSINFIYSKILVDNKNLTNILKNHFYHQYLNLLAENKILFLKEHFLIFFKGNLNFKEKMLLLKIFKYVKIIKIKTKL